MNTSAKTSSATFSEAFSFGSALNTIAFIIFGSFMRCACGVCWANSTDACAIAIETLAFLICKASYPFALVGISGAWALAFLIRGACAIQASIRLAVSIFVASHPVALVYAVKCSSMTLLLACAEILIADSRWAVGVRYATHPVAPAYGDLWWQLTVPLCTFPVCACQTSALRVHVAFDALAPPIVIEDSGSAVIPLTTCVFPVYLNFKAERRRALFVFLALHALATIHFFRMDLAALLQRSSCVVVLGTNERR